MSNDLLLLPFHCISQLKIPIRDDGSMKMYDVSFKVVSLRQILDKWKSLMWTREEGVTIWGTITRSEHGNDRQDGCSPA
jgi:hypothetical protein